MFIDFIYKWLPRVCGCHCRDDRSFHYHGKKFPVCARCTGELAGIIAGIIIFLFIKISWKTAVLFMIPLIIDGTVQLLTSYESTNLKRLITGILFGYGLYTIFAIMSVSAFNLGRDIGYGIIRS